MKCSKIQDILLDYVYGELEPADAVKVEEHVRVCAECASALHEMEFTSKVFKKAESRVPSNHAVENIFRAASEALREEEPAERKIIPLFNRESLRPFLVGAASVMLIIGTVMWIFRPPASQQPVPPEAVKEAIVPTTKLPEDDFITRVSANPEVSRLTSNPQAAENMFEAANILYAQESYDGAFRLYMILYKNATDFKYNYLVSQRIGEIYERFGRTEKALEYYGKSVEQNSTQKELKDKIDRLNAELSRRSS
jgi:tetratricopeptide (TPR) repeat protein